MLSIESIKSYKINEIIVNILNDLGINNIVTLNIILWVIYLISFLFFIYLVYNFVKSKSGIKKIFSFIIMLAILVFIYKLNIFGDMLVRISTPFLILGIWSFYIKYQYNVIDHFIDKKSKNIVDINMVESNKNLEADKVANQILSTIKESKPKSTLLYGPHGSGKTFLSKLLINKLAEDNYKIIKFNAIDFTNNNKIHVLIFKKLIQLNIFKKKWQKKAEELIRIMNSAKLYINPDYDFPNLIKNFLRNTQYKEKFIIVIDELERSRKDYIIIFLNTINVYFNVENQYSNNSNAKNNTHLNPQILYVFNKEFMEDKLEIANEYKARFWKKYIKHFKEIPLTYLKDILNDMQEINTLIPQEYDVSKIKIPITIDLRELKDFLSSLNNSYIFKTFFNKIDIKLKPILFDLLLGDFVDSHGYDHWFAENESRFEISYSPKTDESELNTAELLNNIIFEIKNSLHDIKNEMISQYNATASFNKFVGEKIINLNGLFNKFKNNIDEVIEYNKNQFNTIVDDEKFRDKKNEFKQVYKYTVEFLSKHNWIEKEEMLFYLPGFRSYNNSLINALSYDSYDLAYFLYKFYQKIINPGPSWNDLLTSMKENEKQFNPVFLPIVEEIVKNKSN